jgi:hypothetical protein
MIMQFKEHYHDGIFEITTFGEATLQGLKDLVKAICEDEKWQPGGRILIDHTELNGEPLTVKDIYALAKMVGNYKEQFWMSKIAFLVGRDLEYNLLRMWQTFVATEDWYVSHELFRDRDEAIAWLKNA